MVLIMDMQLISLFNRFFIRMIEKRRTTYNEFRYVQNSNSYRLGDIYDYVKDVVGASAATKFNGFSVTTK